MKIGIRNQINPTMNMVSVLAENGPVMVCERKGVWRVRVSRFLKQLRNPQPLSKLGLNVTLQYFLQHKDQLYFHYNFNFTDDSYFETEGSLEERVYRVDLYTENNRFDLKFTQIWKFMHKKKGRRHPQNLFPLSHPNTLDEHVFESIIRHQVQPHDEIAPSLSLLLSKYENATLYEKMEVGYKANLWWVRPAETFNPHYFYIRFLDATLFSDDEEKWCIQIFNRPYIVLQQIEHPQLQSCDVFFKRKRK